MRRTIIINGPANTGKDEIAKIAKKILDIPVYNISSITPVMEIAKLMGWDGKKDERSRELLSNLKDLWVEFNNGPINQLVKTVDEIDDRYNPPDPYLIFVHIREPEEIEKFKTNYPDTTTVLVKRDSIETYNNRADSFVNEYNYDYIIENNGTLVELEESVRTLLKDINIIKEDCFQQTWNDAENTVLQEKFKSVTENK